MLTLALAKAHLRLIEGDDSEDVLLMLYIDAAVEHVVMYIGQPIPDPAPAMLKAAALLFLSDLYELRGTQVEIKGGQIVTNPAAEMLMHPHRVNLGI